MTSIKKFVIVIYCAIIYPGVLPLTMGWISLIAWFYFKYDPFMTHAVIWICTFLIIKEIRKKRKKP